MSPADLVRIQHMLDAAEEALGFINGRAREDLNDDRMLTLACTRLLEIMGEAASQVSPEFRNLSPHVPWNSVTGMRNRLVHAYYDINLDVLWETLVGDLPHLVRVLHEIIGSTDN